MSDGASFSLVTQPWIQCLDAEGRTVLASLREVFDARSSLVEVRGTARPRTTPFSVSFSPFSGVPMAGTPR